MALAVFAISAASIQAAGRGAQDTENEILLTRARVALCHEALDESQCGDAGGSYVLVVDEGVYRVANQAFEGLAANAGQIVNVGGYLAEGATDTIVITKIERARS
jgi:hypothetical protein